MVVSVVVFAPPIYFIPADVAVLIFVCFGNLAGIPIITSQRLKATKAMKAMKGLKAIKAFEIT